MSRRIQPRIVTTAIMLTALLLQGCPSTPWYPYYPLEGNGLCRATPKDLLSATDLKGIFDEMAAELCVGIAGNPGGYTSSSRPACTGTPRRTVLVTDFVDISSLAPDRPGLLMGELMRSSLNNRCCYRIMQVEFARYFRLDQNGLVVLTRDITEIKKDEFGETECVVGTYSFLDGKVILSARRINTASGTITRMVTREITYDCGGDRITFTVK